MYSKYFSQRCSNDILDSCFSSNVHRQTTDERVCLAERAWHSKPTDVSLTSIEFYVDKRQMIIAVVAATLLLFLQSCKLDSRYLRIIKAMVGYQSLYW